MVSVQVSGKTRQPAVSKSAKRTTAKKNPLEDAQVATAARSRPPPSTNVSSPARGRVKKKQKTRDPLPVFAESDEGENNEDGVPEWDLDSDDGFEPLQSNAKGAQATGPRISQDVRLARLDPLHRDIVHEFVQEAKQVEENMRNAQDLRRPIFSETLFREMALGWTTTLQKMEKIQGIDVGKVRKYGKNFVPLLERFYHDFQEIMGRKPKDPERQTSIPDPITISDDDEEDYEMHDVDDDENDGQQSRYFDGSVDHLSSPVVSEAPATRAGGRGARRTGSSSGTQKGKRSSYSRKSSGGSFRKGSRKGTSGVAKRKNSGTTQGTGRKGGGSSSGGSMATISSYMHNGSKKGGGTSIGMMPI